MSVPTYSTAASLFDAISTDVLCGKRPETYPLGMGDLGKIDFGPGRMMLVGGQPGAGKTAFVMQGVCDLLRLRSDVRVAVCNVEMPPAALLERQVSRLSRIDLTTIRNRQLDERQRGAVQQGLAKLQPLLDRLSFVNPPYTMDNVRDAADAADANVLLIDYIQRVSPPKRAGVSGSEKRGAVEANVNELRAFCSAGLAVIVVGAVARSKDSRGRNSYDSLSLASFRDSSELEFGCDDAFILTKATVKGDPAVLRHLKSRYGEERDISLRFDGATQLFLPEGMNNADWKRLLNNAPPATGITK